MTPPESLSALVAKAEHDLQVALEKRDTPPVAPVAPPTEPSAPPTCEAHDETLWHRIDQLEMRLDLAELEIGKLAGDAERPSESVTLTGYEGQGDEHSESCARLSNLEERMALAQADIAFLKLRAAEG